MASQPLRVLSVVPSMARNTGGPAIGLVQATIAMGTAVERTIYCTDAAQPAASRPFARLKLEQLPQGASQIDLRVFPTRQPHTFAFSPAMFRALAQRVGDVDLVTIHSLNLFPQLAAYLHARRARTPYIVTPHGSLDPWLRANSPRRKAAVDFLWQTKMLEHAAALHFTTPEEAELVVDLAPQVPRHVVPNGVATADFRGLPDGAAFRARFLGGHTGPVVLFVGRVARKKGIDLLIGAFARARGAENALLTIAGPDDEGLVALLRRQAEAAGLVDRVRFIGPLYDDDLRAALAAADLWALTSHTENFGNAVVEAMAAGLPVLVSSKVNIAPAIGASDAGIVTSLVVEEIAEHLTGLLASPERRATLGRRAAGFAERYDWSIVAPRLIEMYQQVVRASRADHARLPAARWSGEVA